MGDGPDVEDQWGNGLMKDDLSENSPVAGHWERCLSIKMDVLSSSRI